MLKNLQFITAILLLLPSLIFAQFGKNKVQYKDFTWYYIQTDHFDIYFTQHGEDLAEFTSKIAEESLASIEKSFDYKINNRISVIVYNSHNDFQETNITDQYLSEGIEGFTELFKNRVVIQFMGSYKEFRHLIHHELTHAVINDMFYGGSFQNIISNNITVNLPQWFNEGMAEYQSLGWDINTDMFIRDAAISEYLPDIQNLNGYFAYRGGQAVFYYIAKKYGKEKIGEIVNKIRGTGSVEEGIRASIGLTLEELNSRWKKDIRKTYWPDIAIRKDPDEFAKRLTDNRKAGGFYNTSPALSPQGDKIAFITDRNYYFDVYLMDAIDGKIIKKLVAGNRTPDFEELNIITPSLTWSPDGEKIALSLKSGGDDVIYLINVESEDKEVLPVKLDGIQSVNWSPDGNKLAFVGHNASQSDIYIYDFNSKKLENLTNDVFTDKDPAWSADSKKIFFVSDREDYLNPADIPGSFKIYKFDYGQNDIYDIDVVSKKIIRVTNTPDDNESFPVVGPDGNNILFISDHNGINNIYRLNLIKGGDAVPITNSLDGLYQLSISKDGQKLVFSSLYEAGFNIFLLNNPFNISIERKEIPVTKYIASLRNRTAEANDDTLVFEKVQKDNNNPDDISFYTGKYSDTTSIYGDSVKIDFNNYVFGKNTTVNIDSADSVNKKFNLTDNLDSNGNYKVNRYKITFSPDIIYANAGYSTFYGLLGTTVLSFSDVLGNHRLIGVTSLQIDLKNSDYGLAYQYLGNRINYGIEGFHIARFIALSRGITSDLYRYRNFGVVGTISYPLNKFYRIETGLSYLNISSENLNDPSEPTEKVSFLLPAASFIHDNVLWGYTAPMDGTRYRFDVFGYPGFFDGSKSFYSFLGDYRTYFKMGNFYSFAFRLSGGYSGGRNPQRFFIGGIENWINRSFATTDIPIRSVSDFAFMTPGLPLRGYDYAEEIGTKYGLMNLEFRFPLIRYLVPGPLPILLSNIFGVAFADVGAAWTNNRDLRLFNRNANNDVVSQDLLMGTGVGARLFFLYFLLRFDVAWPYNVQGFASPKFYVSLGADF
jgi:Tol biopolymer transport system component